MLKAFDTAQPLTSAVAHKAAAAGYQAVGRYYGAAGSGKLLTGVELEILQEAGLAVWCYFERTAGRALLGAAAGAADAMLAIDQAQRLGQPQDTGICFAVDEDTDPGTVLDYFRAVRAALAGRWRLGVYGGGDVCAGVTGAGLADYEILAGAMGWRGSRAYADGRLWEGWQHPAIDAAQSPIGIAIDPVDIVGLHEVGAWSLAGAAPAVPQPDLRATRKIENPDDPKQFIIAGPGITLSHVIDLAGQLQEGLAALGLYTGDIDCQIGSQSSAAALRAYALWRRQTA